MKRRFTKTQIVGFLREADGSVPVKELCHKHGFSEGSYYLWRHEHSEERPKNVLGGLMPAPYADRPRESRGTASVGL